MHSQLLVVSCRVRAQVCLLERKQHVTDDEGKRNWKRRNHSLFGVGAAQDRVLLKLVRRDLLHKSTSKEQRKGESASRGRVEKGESII